MENNEKINKINELKKLQEGFEKETLEPLMKRREELVVEIGGKEEEIGPLKDEIAQLDAHLRVMISSVGMEEYSYKGTKIFFSSEIVARVIDFDEIWDWMKDNNRFDLLRADIIKKTEITKLIDNGIIPKGIKVNTFMKFKSKKIRGN